MIPLPSHAVYARTLDVRVPVNTTVLVYVPSADPSTIRESGRAPTDATRVPSVRADPGRPVIQIGSGTSTFESTLP